MRHLKGSSMVLRLLEYLTERAGPDTNLNLLPQGNIPGYTTNTQNIGMHRHSIRASDGTKQMIVALNDRLGLCVPFLISIMKVKQKTQNGAGSRRKKSRSHIIKQIPEPFEQRKALFPP